VGLENLAFSYSIEDVKKHGDFLERLIEPTNGFIILDLHNLYCHIHNFSQEYEDIIKLYPLDRVREIHISGGSWENSQLTKRKIRRDTHDNAVPPEVFALLKNTILKCPNLKYVVLEQMGHSLRTSRNKSHFYKDYLTMEAIVAESNRTPYSTPPNSFLPRSPVQTGWPLECDILNYQQTELSNILETSTSYHSAVEKLAISSLAHSDWNIENWDPDMLMTAMHIAQKWKK
jgi:hypothetical protein